MHTIIDTIDQMLAGFERNGDIWEHVSIRHTGPQIISINGQQFQSPGHQVQIRKCVEWWGSGTVESENRIDEFGEVGLKVVVESGEENDTKLDLILAVYPDNQEELKQILNQIIRA